MSDKRMVVRLDTHARAHSRLELAADTPEPRAFCVMAGSADYFRAPREQRDERMAARGRLFDAKAARAQAASTWSARISSSRCGCPTNR